MNMFVITKLSILQSIGIWRYHDLMIKGTTVNLSVDDKPFFRANNTKKLRLGHVPEVTTFYLGTQCSYPGEPYSTAVSSELKDLTGGRH